MESRGQRDAGGRRRAEREHPGNLLPRRYWTRATEDGSAVAVRLTAFAVSAVIGASAALRPADPAALVVRVVGEP